MTKYKLLKDIDECNAGQVFEYPSQISVMDSIGEIACKKLIQLIYTNHKEWFEEIKEINSIYELDHGDTCYSIIDCDKCSRGYNLSCDMFKSELELGDIFLTKEAAEIELQKRKQLAGFKKYCFDNPDDKQAQSVLNLLEYKEIEVIDYFNRIH